MFHPALKNDKEHYYVLHHVWNPALCVISADPSRFCGHEHKYGACYQLIMPFDRFISFLQNCQFSAFLSILIGAHLSKDTYIKRLLGTLIKDLNG